jgi:uncharacterized membrane protein HdeD (DUF308 family)
VDPSPAGNLDAEIEAFHRAARRRKAVIFGISGAAMIALGVIALIVTFVGAPATASGVSVRLVIAGIAFIIAGVVSAVNAYRIGSGQIADVED